MTPLRFLLSGALLLATGALAQSYDCRPTNGTNCVTAIPDPGSASSTVMVPEGACGAIVNVAKVVVHATVHHEFVGDLSLSLTAPSGTAVKLLNPPLDGEVPGGCPSPNLDLVFSDGAQGNPGACSPKGVAVSGRVPPAGSLATFAGEARAGIWTLSVTDSSHGKAGAIDHWSLELPCALAHVSLSASSYKLVEGDATPAVVTFTRDGDTQDALLVPYRVSGTAGEADLAQTLSGSVVIPAGSASTSLSLQAVTDDRAEGAETLVLTLDDGAFTPGIPGEIPLTLEDPLVPDPDLEGGGGCGCQQVGGGLWTLAILLAALLLPRRRRA
jgi:subtilisin-like proprotein convertase family protein